MAWHIASDRAATLQKIAEAIVAHKEELAKAMTYDMGSY